MTMNLLNHALFGAHAPLDPQRWIFHYTTLAATKGIAAGRVFRLQRMSTMNDPREYQAVEPVTMAAAAGKRLTPEQVAQAIRRLVDSRLQVAVACFTSDRADGAPCTATRAMGRGYARPSLWAHYADRHRGVCLVLDREAAVRELNTRYNGDAVTQSVHYVHAFDSNDSSSILDLDAVARVGPVAAAEGHLRQYISELLFTKNGDWEAEREWRCCVLDRPVATPVEISLGSGIVQGIVAGLDVPEADLETLHTFAHTFAVEHNVARTYLHQLNMIDVLPIDTTGTKWRYYTREELRLHGYL